MGVEENKALIRRMVEEVYNRGNAAVVDELFAPNFVRYNDAVHVPIYGETSDREGEKRIHELMLSGFPDGLSTIDEMVAEGDIVATRLTQWGTNTEATPFGPATGRRAATPAMNWFRVSGGKITEKWTVFDAVGMMQQLGIMPGQSQAGGEEPTPDPAATRTTQTMPEGSATPPAAVKEIIRRINAEICRGNHNIIDEYYAPDYIQHPPSPGDQALSQIERSKQNFVALRAAFPDVQITADDIVVEGSMVAWRGTFRGTHRGEMGGIPATGRRVEYAVMSMTRFANGRIAENWAVTDQMGMLQQLGVIPAPDHVER